MTQSPVAASKDTLRAAEKSPSHSWCRTRAPWLSAISTVRSVEPVSTTTISSTASRAASRQRPIIASSSLTIMHRLSVRPSAGRAAASMRSTRGCRSRIRPAAWASTRTPARLRRVHSARLRSTLGSSGSRRCAAREQRRRGLDGAELVEDDAGVVEQDRLARVGLEHVDSDGGGGHQRAAASEPLAQAELQERAARLVAAVGVGDLAGLGDDRAIAGPVAGGQAGGRGRDEAGGGDGLGRGRAGGFGGIDETEGHGCVHRRGPGNPEAAYALHRSGDGASDDRPAVQATLPT